MSERLYLGIDVGTGSARAALFDSTGARRGIGMAPFETWRPEEDHVEQSSEHIWRAVCEATRKAIAESRARQQDVVGIGFDATCSLVALGPGDAPLTVSKTGRDEQNVVVWMDHRAMAQAARINASKHSALRYVGGAMSPEMQPPKLLWIKEHLPTTWACATRFFDLPDWLVFRATGADVRSLCTTVCKWTYDGQASRWDDDFWRTVGLGDLAEADHARIGANVRPMGERAGILTAASATELGLASGTPVAVAIIDAHAGGLGLLGARTEGEAARRLDARAFETRLALISGTSSCHMAVSAEPRFIDGIWGPYFSAMVPGLWLTEGGQSATGALLDHVIRSHARAAELDLEAKRFGTSIHALLDERLAVLARGAPFPAALTRELHVLPYFHGNRSPRADPTLRGMITGLRMSDSIDTLALVYLATIQAIAHGTRHIVDTMNAAGYRIDTLIACGGDTKSAVFVREHADAARCRVILPKEREAVVLGAAMLGAVASGDAKDLVTAMGSMNVAETVIEAGAGEVRDFHERKHRIFQRMYEDQMAYRELMAGDGPLRASPAG